MTNTAVGQRTGLAGKVLPNPYFLCPIRQYHFLRAYHLHPPLTRGSRISPSGNAMPLRLFPPSHFARAGKRRSSGVPSNPGGYTRTTGLAPRGPQSEM